jgi:O-antigen chain-terminating methyltransferase
MTADFYRAFEDRFRGSREEILERLAAYEPFVAALDYAAFSGEALDLGCGRGEWLEFLSARGLAAHGVDLDAGMLAACRELGLSAENADALEVLTARPDDSLTLVSGFHFIEHISFDDAREVIHQALRVLEPGGLLILEAPNPENLRVGTELFHLDPSHGVPLPRQLLAFAAEYAGFARVVELGLQGGPDVGSNLTSVLIGVSLDYAIIAQKAGPADVVERLDALFALPFEASMSTALATFDAALLERDARIARLGELEQSLEQALQRTQVSLNQLAQQETTLEEREAALEEWLGESTVQIAQLAGDVQELKSSLLAAQARAAEAQFALDEMWRSRSWRVTKPLRMSAMLARRALGREPQASLWLTQPSAPVMRTVPLSPRAQQYYDRFTDELDASDP